MLDFASLQSGLNLTSAMFCNQSGVPRHCRQGEGKVIFSAFIILHLYLPSVLKTVDVMGMLPGNRNIIVL
jgi:hypothetical protein